MASSLTAFWSDGTSRRALFGRDQGGVVVLLHLVMDWESASSELVKAHWTSASHLVFFLVVALLARSALHY